MKNIHPSAKIHPTAIIYDNVIIEANVEIGPYCIIGAKAESKKHWNEENNCGVWICKDTIITGHVTIDAGTESTTYIEQDCFIMKGVHIGHDALVYHGCTLSPHCIIGGHVFIGHECNIGMGAIIHQRCIVSYGCMIGMGAVITKKTEQRENAVFVGNPARYLRDNNR